MAVVNNVKIFGFEDSVKAAKYPMSTSIAELDSDITKGIANLANMPAGSGEDQWLTGVIVQFDLTFSVKAWTEFQRYHFADFVSSQSSMHRITKFDLDKAYMPYVDQRIIDIMKEKVADYNYYASVVGPIIKAGAADPNNDYGAADLKNYNKLMANKYLEILYSNPCGFKLTARITTNYRQLKTMYYQRRNHRLPEWREFCKWIETLPHAELFIRPKEGETI